MKHTYKIIIFICFSAFLLGVTSCKKFLEELPKDQLSEAQFWNTNDDAVIGVAGIYDGMQAAYSDKLLLWGDFRADNFASTSQSSTTVKDLLAFRINSNNGDALNWSDLYNMISRANVAIERIPGIELYDPNLLAEAYAIRAKGYFDAVRVWGAAPLILKPIRSPDKEPYPAKTDGTTILNESVIPDINKALELMVNETNTTRFSRASIYCLQANVYCYLKQWDKALIALNDLDDLNANGGNFKLAANTTDWSHLFLNDPTLGTFESGPELIFHIKYTFVEDGKNTTNVWRLLHGTTPGLYLSAALENKWVERFPITQTAWEAKYPGFTPKNKTALGDPIYGDYRYFETREDGAAIGSSRVNKYNHSVSNLAEDDTDIPVYRYSDMVLLKALVLNRINFAANKSAAIAQINTVRTARQLPPVTVTETASLSTQDKLENYILDERQFELVGEGKRWWDLIYTDKTVEVMKPINGQTADKLLWPIYDGVIINNPNITQTPGY